MLWHETQRAVTTVGQPCDPRTEAANPSAGQDTGHTHTSVTGHQAPRRDKVSSMPLLLSESSLCKCVSRLGLVRAREWPRPGAVSVVGPCTHVPRRPFSVG